MTARKKTRRRAPVVRKPDPPPSDRRSAERSLRYVEAEGGRIIVGAMWLHTRIISDTREEARDTAMGIWDDLIHPVKVAIP